MITAQEFFDRTVRAIVKQGEPSLDENGICLYRGPNGLKCAVGVWISDEEYREDMEGVPFITFPPDHPVTAHRDLACALQGAHDAASELDGDFPSEFRRHAREVARCFNLSDEVCT